MKIWVDADSGTWGEIGTIYIVDIPESAFHTKDEIIADIDAMSDTQVAAAAATDGVPLSRMAQVYDLNKPIVVE